MQHFFERDTEPCFDIGCARRASRTWCAGLLLLGLLLFLYDRGVILQVLIGSPKHDPMLVDRAVSRKQLIPLHKCSECHFWEPHDVMSSLGECENHESQYYRKAVMRNTESPNCFRPRDLGSSEFLWCETCKQTVSDNELKAHTGHSVFIGTVQFPVEDNIEWTHAGD
jgi:hypothetical protein